METVHEWNAKIIQIIEELNKSHPELLGFLDEIKTTLPDKKDPQINIAILKEYFNELLNLQNIKEITHVNH
jgi:hypothetical protein